MSLRRLAGTTILSDIMRTPSSSYMAEEYGKYGLVFADSDRASFGNPFLKRASISWVVVSLEDASWTLDHVTIKGDWDNGAKVCPGWALLLMLARLLQAPRVRLVS